MKYLCHSNVICPYPVFGGKRVTISCHHHVLISVQHTSYWSLMPAKQSMCFMWHLHLNQMWATFFTPMSLYISLIEYVKLLYPYANVWGNIVRPLSCLFYAVFLMLSCVLCFLIKRIWMNEWMTAWGLNSRCICLTVILLYKDYY